MEAHKSRILSATLVCPASPFGFGGTSGVEGKLNNEEGSGSGGGTVPHHNEIHVPN